MVSTRSKSVLSADNNHEDTAATHGEVSSAAPTPRRSGRLRSSGTAATPTAATAAPRTSGRTRKLRVIEEEQEQREAQNEEEEEQPAQASPPSANPTRGRSGRAAAATSAGTAGPAAGQAPAETAADHGPAGGAEGGATQPADQEQQQQQSDGEAAGPAAQPLKAGAAVVDVLAEKMFAALEAAFGEQRGSSSDSESDSQQAGGMQRGAAAAALEDTDASDSDSDSDGEGLRRAGDNLPRHLRWRPELTLPGMQRGREGGPGPSAETDVPAAAVAVHAVARGGDGVHVAAPDERELARAARKAAPDTAGRGWFDLPATRITDEVKADLRMLRLRGALDPKAHYKKLDSTKFPKYFQMGTVVEGPTDFYSGRLTKKQRKRTLTEEVMADQELTQVRKKRYAKLQEEQQRWSKRKTGRKTNNERKKKAHHRAKH